MTTTNLAITLHPLQVAAIQAKAAEATLQYSTIDEACPHIFGTEEAYIFIQAFTAERDRQNEHIVKEAFADVGQRATIAAHNIIAEIQHNTSIASDATNDTSDTIAQTEAEAEDALQTAFATAILAGADSIQPIKD